TIALGPDVFDFVGNPMNQDGDENNGEADDDVFTGSFDWSLPDLVVTDGTLATDASSYSFGQSLTIDFDLQNIGSGDAGGQTWVNRIYLSADGDWDPGDRLLGSWDSETTLAAGASEAISQTLTLPLEQGWDEGDYRLLVVVDDDQRIGEVDEANTFASDAIALAYPPLVDLVPQAIDGPVAGRPGQDSVFTWTVTNQGDEATAGAWFDHIFLRRVDDPGVRVFVGTRRVSGTFGPGESYDMSMTTRLPDAADGAYQIEVESDHYNNVFEGPYEDNNRLLGNTVSMSHVDLVPSQFSVPAAAISGTEVDVTWNIANTGTAIADAWTTRFFLSTDNQYSFNDRLVGELRTDTPLAAGTARDASATVSLPVDFRGNLYLVALVDALDEHGELLSGEQNNDVSRPIELTLAPYADLGVSDIDSDDLEIGDPGSLRVQWTVTNQGTGRGGVDTWNDVVVLRPIDATDARFDRIIATFPNVMGLDAGESYTRDETFALPPELNDRFELFIHTDAGDVVYENDLEANNVDFRPGYVDIMAAPNADVIVTNIDAPPPINAGTEATVSWTVENVGRGITDRGDWYDRIYLASDPAGDQMIDGTERFYQHFGQLAVGGTYVRTATIAIPDGLQGDHFIVVETAAENGPFEFIFDANNTTVSDPIDIVLRPAPDLIVTETLAPTEAEEGAWIDVSWTVQNDSTVDPERSWADRVYLRPAGQPNAPLIELGVFPYLDPLPAGQTYTRAESIRVPVESTGVFDLIVHTNYDGFLYEGPAADNNTRSRPITLNVKPRADLQVESIDIPDRIAAGATLSPSFVVVNQGAIGTGSTRWVDRAYLSLDTVIDQADILIGELDNAAALLAGDRYSQDPGGVVVPIRYRGDVYVIVQTDSTDRIEEWPTNENNVTYQSIFVEPEPLADLVVSDVIAPTQVIAGAEVPLRYTVTNLGSGATHGDTWGENVWLTRDKNRPHPGKGDILLESFTHSGALDRNAGYETNLTIQIPSTIPSGIWYVTPWVDPLDTIPEDTLAANVNDDDPNQADNNNYKAREIQVLGAQPDLVVSDIIAPVQAVGGDQISITWTVENIGFADAEPGKWIDNIFLSDRPDPDDLDATMMLLAQVKREFPLAQGASYTDTAELTLSPSASGSYIVVVTDDEPPPQPPINLTEYFGGPPPEEFNPVDEVDETNNSAAVVTNITPVPANLKVVSVDFPDDAKSGEEFTFSYTVENIGAHPVWEGTRYWKDFIWLSPDTQFIRNRASYLGSPITAMQSPLQPGQQYTVTYTTTLPEGTGGDYSLWIHLDAHNDKSPLLFPYQARLLLEDWYPAAIGTNDIWLDHFDRWAYEDPSDNLSRHDLQIEYFEADLRVTNFQIPDTIVSGETIDVTYTVENIGNRATRTRSWTDRVFISHDASLDNFDHQIAAYGLGAILEPGESYTRTMAVTIPHGIEGDFHLMVFADSAAMKDRANRPSNIGFELVGIEFELPGSLEPWDLASEATRRAARGRIKEFAYEGNNLVVAATPILPAVLPDLQVAQLTAPLRADRGSLLNVEYTVSNLGGEIIRNQEDWDELVYLSRDNFLDLSADIYLGGRRHEDGLAPGESITQSQTVRLPRDLTGPFYVFVIVDPDRIRRTGDVFEGANERNNDRGSDVPMVIELPPPVDLEVTAIQAPPAATTGDPAEILWTVTNTSTETVTGTWSDAIYFSPDAQWDLTDAPAGNVEFTGTLGPGESYSSTLVANTPPLTPGDYRIIVRTDIFNAVYEDVDDLNNTTASPTLVDVTAPVLTLDVPFPTMIQSGDQKLFAVDVPSDQTLRVTVSTGDDSVHEVFLRHLESPTVRTYDASSGGTLAGRFAAVVPSTLPGRYYVLVRGFATPEGGSDVEVLAETLPLAITDIRTDIGGDSKFVTTTIEGARFHPDAILKLVRPGAAEISPVSTNYVSASQIIAKFDFTDMPRGLYDVQVINPGGQVAVVPYRFQIERTIEPEVTIGVGGPRYIFAGDNGTFSVALQNLGNVDAPYVFYNVGIPEMGINGNVYNLPYHYLASNLRGGPEVGPYVDVPWAQLNSAVNTDGHVTASGYQFDSPADGFSGFTFQVQTYPGLRELHDHAWEAFKAKIYEALPQYAEIDLLAEGPEKLDEIYPGLTLIWEAFGAVPDLLTQAFIPYQFHVVASATSMSRDEFIAHSTQQADILRRGILDDPDADAALVSLAGDADVWRDLYLASLEESGRLLPEDAVPDTRRDQELQSLMSLLAGGVIRGPGGETIIASGRFDDFFENVRLWYGHDPDLLAPAQRDDASFTSDSQSILGTLGNPNPVPGLPQFEDYDLGLDLNTHFQTTRVYVPWVPFGKRGAGIPADYQIRGITTSGDDEPLFPLNFQSYYDNPGNIAQAVSQTGPFTLETRGFVPAETDLPFSVHFQNDPAATRDTNEIRVVVPLDESVDPRTFRLGDLKFGDINIRMPSGRSLYQGEFDFLDTLGFNVRVSAGVDIATNTASWLIQAIDPLTGAVRTDPTGGLLPPNNAQGAGAGFVGYSVRLSEQAETGDTLTAQARVLMDNAPPEDAAELVYEVDALAPQTELTVSPINDQNDFRVAWDVADEETGSGFKHVSLYVAEDGGDFQLWKRQLTDASGEDVYAGRVGRTYEFLALASDRAGNRETPPSGRQADDDGSRLSLGDLPEVDSTTRPNFGTPPTPDAQPSTNPLFSAASARVPANVSISQPPVFQSVLQPFTAQSFASGFDVTATGVASSGVGPLAILSFPPVQDGDETIPGDVLISGGPSRNQIYRFTSDGGLADGVWAETDHPIFNLALDASGRLWATTGGGPLLELDPIDGAVLAEHGDGLTMGLAVDPVSGDLFVGSRYGVERFDPATSQFERFSRDKNIRVGSLAFDDAGVLHAVQWPERDALLRFNGIGRAESIMNFAAPIDSIAFGKVDSPLEGLLFISHNTGDTGFGRSVATGEDSPLTMVDMATLQRLPLATGGTRGDALETTADGRILVSQSDAVDVIRPLSVPRITATYPAPETTVALPLGMIAVSFSEDMFVGTGLETHSVTNPGNYAVRLADALTPEEHPVVTQVQYHASSRTAYVFVEGFSVGQQTLYIGQGVQSAGGFELPAGYEVPFQTVSEFTADVDFTLTGTRLDRAESTVTYEVEVTNAGDYDLLLPMTLTFDASDRRVTAGGAVPAQPAIPDGDQWQFTLDASELPDQVRLRPGETTTARSVRFLAPGNVVPDFVPGFIAATTANLRPQFSSDPVVDAVAGQEYEYSAIADDPDGVAIAYLLHRGPDGLVVDRDSGWVTWQPDATSPAKSLVTIQAMDSRGGSVFQTWTLEVQGGNRAPELISPPDEASLSENQNLYLSLSVVDPDGDAVTLWMDNLPPGAFFDPDDQMLRWTPAADAAGVYRDVEIVADDGVNIVRHHFDLTVSDANRPPVVVQPDSFTVRQGDVWTLRLDATDPDGDPLLITSSALPRGATLDARDGTLRW
ncbi:MAG: CARDB domain-containing protein, partial [Planctomycetota bacterium]